jgi:nicotinamide riboside transporter PnuC
MSVYGWYNWAKGDNEHELEITRTNRKANGFNILVTMFITYLVYVAF